MKVYTFLVLTSLSIASVMSSPASAAGQCNGYSCKVNYSSVGSASDVAQQYANGGPFGGVASGTTGTTLDVARDSMNFLGLSDRIASAHTARKAHFARHKIIHFAAR